MKKIFGFIMGICILLFASGVLVSLLSSTFIFILNLTTASPDVPFFIQPVTDISVWLITHCLVWFLSLWGGLNSILKAILTEIIALIISFILGYIVSFIVNVGVLFIILTITMILSIVGFALFIIRYKRKYKVQKTSNE